MSSSGVKGLAPCAFSHRFFAQKSGVAESRRLRDPAAERQRPQEADQIESRNKKLHTLLCAARAVPFSQGLTMRGQGACPLRSLGISKGPFSTVENGPFGRAAVRRQMWRRRQAANVLPHTVRLSLTRSPVSGCRRPRRPSSASSGSARRRCSWP